MSASKEQRERVAQVGETLRAGVDVPTDTYITGDIPLLLTRLSQVEGVRKGDRPKRSKGDTE
ncbi:hypothetical protein D9601_00960 [Sphingomonas sp. MA1305]|uniref:hypothetical protein n=1 Tax=Sphingomonas sp. MA1305 TaxID=2479204 RepID=UPI0018DFE188|nr:hypothetical protein [Sphingomonas sp. MA1305]MBI0473933.1 hypothetical protein [Sphingomonas sp. MA1305]